MRPLNPRLKSDELARTGRAIEIDPAAHKAVRNALGRPVSSINRRASVGDSGSADRNLITHTTVSPAVVVKSRAGAKAIQSGASRTNP